MRSFEARDHVIASALDVSRDRLDVEPMNAHTDAQAEYHEDGLDDAARRLVVALGRERGEAGGLVERLTDLGADETLIAEVVAMMDGLRRISKFAREHAHSSPEIARDALPA